MKPITCLLFLCTLASSVDAKTININLFNNAGSTESNQIINGDAAGNIPIAAQHWNNIGFNNGDLSGAAAQRNLSVKDDQGNSSAATFISSLNSAYVGYSGASQGEGSASSRSLMNSYLAFKPSDGGGLQINGLDSTFTSPGYRVYVYFDTDSSNRSHTLTLTPLESQAMVKAGDDSGTYSGTFVQTTGAGNYANFAVFENVTSRSFTLAMDSSVGRAAVNGIQIVSNDHVFPPSIESFSANDYYVTPGTAFNLSWQTTGATSISITPQIGDVTSLSTDGDGNTSSSATSTTTYTLTASNTGGSTTATLRMGVGLPKPNILFFLVDDMGWQDTSVPFHYDASGDPQPSANQTNKLRITPNMERLATQGMKFTSAYACSVCSPTRVSIMTGMNATRHHVTTWTHPSTPQDTGSNNIAHLKSPSDWHMAGMKPSDIALPKLLQETGYRTIHAGKAHFGTNSSFAGNPQAIGFDINIAGHGAGGPGSYLGTNNYGTGIWHVPGLEQYHGTDTFLSEALTLEMNKAITASVSDGVPFFAYMAHYAVHVPWQADSRFTANYPSLSGNALAYATLIEGMDKSLGDILTNLEQLGVAENTIVIFYSDNGSDAANPILRGKKGQYWEGGIRVPMIASWAKPDANNPFQSQLSIPAGSREDDIVSCEDMFATVASIAGASYSHPVDGHDLSPYFRATPGTHRPQEFIQHFPHGHNHDHFALMRQGDWKIIHQYSNGSTSLYNLANDIGESNNVAASHPERLMSMVRHLRQQLDAMGAQYSVNKNTNQAVPPALPNLPAVDVDQDGIPDLTEDKNQNGLVDPGETNPDNDNTDGDNINDGGEAKIGTDPLDLNSYFKQEQTLLGDGALQLTWPSSPTARFTIRSSTDLIDWSHIVADDIAAAAVGSQTSYTLPHSSSAQHFYQVVLK
ncbi:sulfatase [Verrucomicrobiaceae bacterium N1E253]|uniref:Sulfatase n=1 Tax=Oceaniferula marina TaxID=2748318 RepID=A0A851GCA2_9BACT|nr:sulfatase-like hydrolase/transferase [Oceaniferula marina]NWK55056.1 sulfatase [Oceaniferula marina]